MYNTNFSRGGNFRYIHEFGFCAKFCSRENNIHCEWNFAKFSSREIFYPRNVPPRENKNSNSGLSLYNIQKNGAFVHITNSSLIVGKTGIRNVVKPSGLIKKMLGAVFLMVRCFRCKTWIHAACAGGIPPKLQCDMCQQ